MNIDKLKYELSIYRKKYLSPEDMKKLSTKRLLTYHKSLYSLKYILGLEEYMQSIKEELNTREHIEKGEKK